MKDLPQIEDSSYAKLMGLSSFYSLDLRSVVEALIQQHDAAIANASTPGDLESITPTLLVSKERTGESNHQAGSVETVTNRFSPD